jgi:peptidoglycan hydrolase FlgJ
MASVEGLSSISLPVPSPIGAANARLGKDNGTQLKTMARDFEAMFLTMMLKEMRQTTDAEGGLFQGDSGDIQGGLFDHFMGNHLADTGGVGIAAMVRQQLQPLAGTNPHDDGLAQPRGILPGPSRS